MEAIQIQNLTKQYSNFTAVNHLNLTVHTGELFALLGINGAGKTTLLRMLSCLTKPTDGDAQIHGYSILCEPQKIHRIINLSPQETAVASNLSVLENLELIAGIYEIPHPKNAAEDIIRKFSMEEISRKRAGTLSGGWQRRLSIAMALISQPKVLFLDEPTLGLDVLARRQLWQMIAQLKQQMTIILTTHYLEEAEALSDRVGILQNGSLKALGTPAELIARAGTKTFEDAFITLSGGMNV